MTYLFILYAFLTLIALTAMLYGFRHRRQEAITISIWSNIGAISILYNLAQGEILGTFFNYSNSMLYTLNLIILLLTISYIILKTDNSSHKWVYTILSVFFSILLILGGGLLLINVWINAKFIEDQQIAAPILQVANLGQNPHCAYKYVFYKKNREGKVTYLCPNYYGLIPRVQTLDTTPAFIEQQFNLLRPNAKQ